MTIQLSAFRWVPPFAQGFVRDLRLRWALEEAGLAYETVLVDPEIKESEAYRAWQPFGQVPAYRDETVEMFESGAIVLHIAAKSETLCPKDAAGRARVVTWVLAALNSVEPHTAHFIEVVEWHAGEAWAEARTPQAEARMNDRLASLCAWMEDGRDYLEGRFTAADIVMATVLRELEASKALERFPVLDAYRARCLARPAFAKALADQLRVFQDNAPA